MFNLLTSLSVCRFLPSQTQYATLNDNDSAYHCWLISSVWCYWFLNSCAAYIHQRINQYCSPGCADWRKLSWHCLHRRCNSASHAQYRPSLNRTLSVTFALRQRLTRKVIFRLASGYSFYLRQLRLLPLTLLCTAAGKSRYRHQLCKWCIADHIVAPTSHHYR